MNDNLEFENEDPSPNSIEDNHPRTNYGEGFGNQINLPNQETLEEAAENFWLNDDSMSGNDRISYVNGFKQGAKWQQERMYSEEDMKNAFDSAREFNSLDGIVDVHIVLPMGGDMSDLQPLHFTFEEWFEQFKKK